MYTKCIIRIKEFMDLKVFLTFDKFRNLRFGTSAKGLPLIIKTAAWFVLFFWGGL